MPSRSESVMFLTNFAVMPSGGFLIYFSLSFSMNFGFIVSLLSFDSSSMEQTGDKIKQINCWKGSDILQLPFHRVFPEKQACVCGRVPETPFGGYTSDTLGDRNQRIRERADAIY